MGAEPRFTTILNTRLSRPQRVSNMTSQHTESVRPRAITLTLANTQGKSDLYFHTRQGCEETSFQTMKFGRDWGGGASFGNHCQIKQYADIILSIIHAGSGIDKVSTSSCDRDCPSHSLSQPQQPTGLSGFSMCQRHRMLVSLGHEDKTQGGKL